MLIVANNLYSLNKDGRLHIWDLNTLEKILQSTDTLRHYTAIAKDNNNQVFLGTDKGKIYKLDNSEFTTRLFIELKKTYRISDIFFNSKDEIFLIVPYAIYDPINNEHWKDFKHERNGMIVRKRFLIFFRKRTNTYFDMPQYTFIDSNDRIWMTKSFGEFGGSIQIFDARKREEIIVDIDSLNYGLFFPKSVFEDDDKNIYITSGLQHFSSSGEIYKIENSTATEIYNSDDFIDTTDTRIFSGGIFVGPGTYNSTEKKIYFATSDGFYKADIPNKGRIKKPELIFTSELTWEREPFAIGVGMTIKKLCFAKNNVLVFLTSNNGIGVYNGIRLQLLQ